MATLTIDKFTKAGKGSLPGYTLGKGSGHFTWQVFIGKGAPITKLVFNIMAKLDIQTSGSGRPEFTLVEQRTATKEEIGRGGFFIFIKDKPADQVRIDLAEYEITPTEEGDGSPVTVWFSDYK